MNQILKGIYDAILEGERENTKKQVQAALEQGVEARTILDKMIEAMGEVGRLFEEGEYFVPEMLISARSMQEGLGVLKPHLAEADVKAVGKVVAGTVKGDLHDIGKNLVVMMLEGGGFEVVDLGCDVSPEQFVQAVKETGAQIVAMSALLTTTMPNMKVTIDALKEAWLRDKVKVMVGGAPLNAQYAEQIGADGYSPDAPGAVRLAKSLL